MHAVRCPSCRNLSRVGADALGRTVACPHCGRPFPAAPDPAFTPPVVRRAKRARPRVEPPAPAARDDSADLGLGGSHAGPSPALLGLVLLPLGIPLLWLAGPVLTGK